MIKSLKTINYSGNLRVVFHYLLLIGVVLFFSGITASCTKKPTPTGGGIIPDSTMTAFYTDTMAIRTFSSPFDSVSTNEKSYYIVGSMTDPVFGTTETGFYTQLGQAVTHGRFGPNPKVDSLVLMLAYSSVYGDTNSVLRLHVYELNEDLEGDSTIYYSNKVPAHYPTDYADYTFRPNVKNQIILGAADTVKGVIRVNLSKIDPGLANKLIQTDTTDLDSNYLFVKYFKGLYITSDLVSGKGAIVSFTPSSVNTQMGLYYHNDTVDSLSFFYVYGTGMAYANHYAHDYTKGSTELQQQVLQNDTVLGQQQYYIQGLSGIKTVIKFPNVKKLARLGKIGINEAKLILPGKEVLPYFGAPTTLTLLKIASDTSYSTLVDETEGSNYFGGTYDSISNSYQFRITHYIQSLVSDTTQDDRGLLLYISGGTILPQRFIFNGPEPVNDTLSRTKLELLYTKFN
ncbi:MAG: DUF4270 domain-containing protein [Bacteroidales bacterium]|nr:DUF4270 domain-containing protein [Bacteroidales bacterium]